MAMSYRKMDARNFHLIHDILRYLSLVQSLLKGRNEPITRIGNRGVKFCWRSNFQAFSNPVLEVDQGEGEFPSNYYYDYEFNLEQQRRKKIEEKIAKEEEQKKTLKYKFNTLEKEDQWSLIGAACCVIGPVKNKIWHKIMGKH